MHIVSLVLRIYIHVGVRKCQIGMVERGNQQYYHKDCHIEVKNTRILLNMSHYCEYGRLDLVKRLSIFWCHGRFCCTLFNQYYV